MIVVLVLLVVTDLVIQDLSIFTRSSSANIHASVTNVRTVIDIDLSLAMKYFKEDNFFLPRPEMPLGIFLSLALLLNIYLFLIWTVKSYEKLLGPNILSFVAH